MSGYTPRLPANACPTETNALLHFPLCRPLRTLTAFPGMKVVISSIVNSIPALGNVAVLLLFTLFVVAMIGVELFSGVLQGQCAYVDPSTQEWTWTGVPCALPCSEFETYCTATYGTGCSPTFAYPWDETTNSTMVVPVDTLCRRGENPDWGQTNFDNVGAGMLTGYVVLTTEGWSALMYVLWHTFGVPAFVSIFFIVFILFGCFFLLSLALAVINDEYEKAEIMAERGKDALLSLLDSTNVRTQDLMISRQGGFGGLAHELARLQSEARAAANREEERMRVLMQQAEDEMSGADAKAPASAGNNGFGIVTHIPPEVLARSKASSNSLTGTPVAVASVDGGSDASTSIVNPMKATAAASATPVTPQQKPKRRSIGSPTVTAAAASAAVSSGLKRCWKAVPPVPACLAKPAQAINQHWFFGTFMVTAIIANSLSLACEYEGMDASYEEALNYANYAFVAIFAFEFLIKLLALGATKYAGDRFNLFDGVVVLVSIIEVFLDNFTESSGGGISALRTFRMLRVLKLARSWKQLNKLITTLASIIPDVSNASVVLLVVMFIFALLGMQLFGGTYDKAVQDGIIEEVPRSNFNTLWWSIVTVFQVVTNENWNDVLHVHMAYMGTDSFLYFVALVVIGNYVFLNLFLAILLNGFEDAEAEAEKQAEADALEEVPSPPGWMSRIMEAIKDAVRWTGTECRSRCPGECQICGFCECIAPKEHQTPASPTAEDTKTPKPAKDDSDSDSSKRIVAVNPLSTATASAGASKDLKAAPEAEQALPQPSPEASSPTVQTVSPTAALKSRPGLPPIHPAASPASGIPAPLSQMSLTQRRSMMLRDNSADTSSSSVSIGSTTTVEESVKPSTAAAPPLTIGRPPPVNIPMVPSPPVSTIELDHPTGRPAPTPMSFAQSEARAAIVERGGGTTAMILTVPSSPLPGDMGLKIQVLKSGDLKVTPMSAIAMRAGDDPLQRAATLQAGKFPGINDVVPESPAPSKKGGKRGAQPPPPRPPNWFQRLMKRIRTRLGLDDDGIITRKQSRGDASSSGSDDEPFTLRKLARMKNHNSLGCLSPTNPIRLAAATVVCNPWFERLTLLVILISSINLAIDEPRVPTCSLLPDTDPDNCIALADYLQGADYVITGYFVLEMVLKLVAQGIIFHPSAYMRSGWNVLDGAIVIVSVVSLSVQSGAVKALRAFRALRALRPLRVVSRFPGLKLVVNSVLQSLPKLMDITLVVFLFIFIFAVVGMQNFRGAFNVCNDPDVVERADCTGMFTLQGDMCAYLPTQAAEDSCRNSTGVDFPRLWQPIPANYDNIFIGLLTVYELATGENWPTFMMRGVDSVGSHQGMQRDNNPAAAIYFIVVQVVLAFVLLDFFAGVVVDTYNDLRDSAGGAGLLTSAQRIWVENMKVMLTLKPKPMMEPPSHKQKWLTNLRHSCFKLANSSVFEYSVMALILGNVLFLALKHLGMDDQWGGIIENANYVFTFVFALEAIIKLLGFGSKQYFARGWNRFDFFLVIAGIASAGASINASINGSTASGAPIATLLRMMRILRLFRMLRVSRGLQRLLRTLILSLPSLGNVAAMLFLVYFIFAIVGMNLFAGVRYGAATTGNINEDANFDSFLIAFITLFRCSTGEDFNGMMHDLMVSAPYCSDDDITGNCGQPILSPIFFVIFFSFTEFFMIKLLIAIVLDGFLNAQEASEATDKAFKLTEPAAKNFRQVWQTFDVKATKVLDYIHLRQLLLDVDYPLGLANHPRISAAQYQDASFMRRKADRLLDNLTLVPDAQGRFQFHAVLHALVSAASGGSSLGAPMGTVAVLGSASGSQGFTLREIRAAITLQSVFRAKQAKKLVEQRKMLMRLQGSSVSVRDVRGMGTGMPPPMSGGSKNGGSGRGGFTPTPLPPSLVPALPRK